MSDTTDLTEQMQSTPDADGRGQLVNDRGDATDPVNSVNPVIKRVMQWVKASISQFSNQ